MPVYEFVGKTEDHRMVKHATPLRQLRRLFGRQDEPEEERAVAKTFDKAAFVKSAEGSGVPLNEQHEAKRGIDSDQVQITGELNSQYETFLRHYVKNMMELKKMPAPAGAPGGARTMFDMVLNDVDRKFFNELVDANGEVNTAQMERMLETAEGWMLTTSLMDQQRALTFAGLALDAAARPDSTRVNIIGSQTVRLGTGQGALNRMWNNMTPGQRTGLVAGGLLAAGVGGGAVGGLLAGNALLGAAAVGGATAGTEAIVGSIGGLLNSIQNGNTIDVRQCTDALRYIQSNNTLKLRMKVMSNIDVDDYVINGGRVEMAANRIPESRNLQESFRNALRLTATRSEYHTELGLDPEQMDASPEQAILRAGGNRLNFESASTRMEDRIMEIFNPNDPHMPPETHLRLARMQEARQKAMLEMFQSMTDKILRDEKDAKMEMSVSKIDQLLAELSDDGVAAERLRAPLNNEKQMIGEVNGAIRGDISTIEAYMDAIRGLQQTRDQVAREFGPGANIAALEAELNQRTNVSPERLREMREQLVRAETEMNALNAAGEQIDTRFDAAAASLTNLLNIDAVVLGADAVGLNINTLTTLPLNDILARINEANRKGAAMVPPQVLGWPASQNSHPTIRASLYLQIGEAQARRANALVGTPSPDALFARVNNISEHVLRTAPIDDIARRIDAAGGLPAVGALPAIPHPDINNPAHRQRIQNIINESQTRFTVRMNSFRELVKREQNERQELNQTAAGERARLQDSVNRDRQELNSLQQEETNLNALRNLDTMAKNVLDSSEAEYFDSFEQVRRAHEILSKQTPPVLDLDPANLATMPLADLRDRINRNGTVINMPVDPDAQRRFLVDIRSEAQAREAGGADFTVETPAMAALLAHGVNERTLREKSADDIETALRRINVRVDLALRNQITEAKAEVIARRNLRIQSLRRNINTAVTEGPDFVDSSTSFLRTVSEYRTAENTFRTHLARLGVADRAALETRIQTNSDALNNIREHSDISALLNAIVQEEESYGNALRNLQTVRTQMSASLNGANTIAQIDSMVDRRTRIDETQLRSWIDSLRTAETGLNGGTETQALITDLETQFGELTRFGPDSINAHLPMADAINDDALATQTVDTLLRRINQANEASRAAGGTVVGWAERDNARPEVRQRLVRAMAEARARQAEPDIAAPPFELFQRFADGLTETQLMAMSPEEAIAEANRRGAAYTGADIPAFQAAKDAVQRREAARVTAMNALITANDERNRDIDERLADPALIDTVRQRRTELEVMKRSIQERGARMGEMTRIIRAPQEFVLTQIVSATDVEFTAAERASGLPKGMIELYNILYPYQDRIDRDVAFQDLLRIVPPQDMIDTFRRVIPSIGRVRNPVQFLRRLQSGIDTGVISSYELRNVVREMADRTQGRAMALTLTA